MTARCLICGAEYESNDMVSVREFSDLPSGVCPACLTDAKMGRLVRGMPGGSVLMSVPKEAQAEGHGKWAYAIYPNEDTVFEAETPEEALERAMGEAK